MANWQPSVFIYMKNKAAGGNPCNHRTVEIARFAEILYMVCFYKYQFDEFIELSCSSAKYFDCR